MRIMGWVLLCFCLTGCGRDGKAALRSRAEKFGNFLVRIQDMPEAEATRGLEGFIEPSPTRAERIAEYYREFSAASKKFRIVSQSVEKIKIGPEGVNAEVTYQMVAEGMKIPMLQVTGWKHVGGKWCRTVGEPQKKLHLR